MIPISCVNHLQNVMESLYGKQNLISYCPKIFKYMCVCVCVIPYNLIHFLQRTQRHVHYDPRHQNLKKCGRLFKVEIRLKHFEIESANLLGCNAVSLG
jgi:hypothetical protein